MTQDRRLWRSFCLAVLSFLPALAAPPDRADGDRPRVIIRREAELAITSTGVIIGTGHENTQVAHPMLIRKVKEVFAGHQEHMDRRLKGISDAIRSDFEARPENAKDKIPPQAVIKIARTFFAKEHGWVMKGLEPTNLMPKNASRVELHDLPAFRHTAPEVSHFLRTMYHVKGHLLNLADTAAIVAALEWLTLQRSLHLLDAAYALNGLSTKGSIDRDALDKVLQSYLLMFRMGYKADFLDAGAHDAMKKSAMESSSSGSWKELVDFESAVVDKSSDGQSTRFTHDMAETAVLEVALRYGKWQNRECLAMKADLMKLDGAADGMVPLASARKFPADQKFGYEFSESTEYLRRIGAIDEEIRDSPNLIIPNYLSGPTNCIATTLYTAVCCINECEDPIDQLEQKFRTPGELPSEILKAMEGISTATMPTPRKISKALAEKLQIARDPLRFFKGDQEMAGNGRVPFRSASFAQWLHSALPNECSRPLSSGTENDEHVIPDLSHHVALVENAAAVPLHHLLGAEKCTRLPAYMSVVI